jgi:hypothetical protein
MVCPLQREISVKKLRRQDAGKQMTKAGVEQYVIIAIYKPRRNVRSDSTFPRRGCQ